MKWKQLMANNVKCVMAAMAWQWRRQHQRKRRRNNGVISGKAQKISKGRNGIAGNGISGVSKWQLCENENQYRLMANKSASNNGINNGIASAAKMKMAMAKRKWNGNNEINEMKAASVWRNIDKWNINNGGEMASMQCSWQSMWHQ